MITALSNGKELQIPEELVVEELNLILLDPIYQHSGILRKFLSFIVEQTLLGHENWLKEYTIAINVLNKPSGFKPQENGIVRIHAGRLRRALNEFYQRQATPRDLRITIPKGSYVPVFLWKDQSCNQSEYDSSDSSTNWKKPVIGVIPFNHSTIDPSQSSLADGLGLQLSNELMKERHFSVISYYTMQRVSPISKKPLDIFTHYGAQFLITGEIQLTDQQFRIHVELVNTANHFLVWSEAYSGIFSEADLFQTQDEIVSDIIHGLKELDLNQERLNVSTSSSVA